MGLSLAVGMKMSSNRNAFSLISAEVNVYPSASDIGRSISSNSRVWKDWNSWKNRVSVFTWHKA